MPEAIDLRGYTAELVTRGLVRSDLAPVIAALESAGRKLARLIARGNRAGNLADCIKADNGAGDSQKKLDVLANEIVVDALREAPVAWLASEECEACVAMTPGAAFSIAVDPLDGSSNIETNVPIGTIFSILPASPAARPAPPSCSRARRRLRPASSSTARNACSS